MEEINHNNNDYILLYNRRSDTDIQTFIERNYIYGITPEELFELNRGFIWQQYTELDKDIHKRRFGTYPEDESYLNMESFLPNPCVLKINPSRVTAELAISQTNAQVNTEDFYCFAYEKIQDIFQNDGYRVSDSEKRNPTCSVFGWFKSLYFATRGENDIKKKNDKIDEFADLSKYIISLSTSVTENGGSFTIKLPIINSNVSDWITTEVNESSNKDLSIRGGVTKDENVIKFNKEYYSKSCFNEIESNYFNWLISSNDLIFISFEKLDIELKRENKTDDSDNFEIGTMISNGVFDMIGLVDDVKVISNAQSSDAYVEVTGRDLMKLLIEDGSFFFDYSTTSDPSSVFANEQSFGKQGDIRDADKINNVYNNPINRLRRIGGEIDVFANRINMDISYVLKGVISRLANVEIVPGYVFDSWGEDRTKYVELEPEKKE